MPTNPQELPEGWEKSPNAAEWVRMDLATVVIVPAVWGLRQVFVAFPPFKLGLPSIGIYPTALTAMLALNAAYPEEKSDARND